MRRIKFYLGKINLLAHFIWWRKWKLVRDEWNMTYEELEDAKKRLPEIEQEAIERLLNLLEETECDEGATTKTDTSIFPPTAKNL